MKTPLETTMNGYDTIVAVTQNNINANFKFLYGAKGGIQPTIKLYDDNKEEGIDAVIDPPTVRLNVNKEPSKIIFQLNLKRGKLTYWKGRGRSAQLQEQPIQNWLIGFKVDLDLTDMDARDIPKEIQEKLKPLTPTGAIDPSLFSVRQLFMNFQNAFLAGLDKSATVFPKDVADPNNPNKLKDEDLDFVFFKFLQKYLEARRHDGNILGYAIYTKNPNAIRGLDPTFPPTNVTFATNLFLPEGKEKPDFSSSEAAPGEKPGGLDTLNFLLMTNHRAWPLSSRSGPPWFGNWATSKEQYGTVAIARHLFVDEYLLKELAKTTTLKSSLEFSDISAGMSISYSMRVPTQYSPEGTYHPDQNNLGIYTYDSGEFYKKLELDAAGYAQDHHWRVRHTAKAEIPKGGNVVQVSGTSVLKCDITHWHGYRDGAAHTPYWRQGTVTWKFSITLSSVTAGGLHVDVTDLDIKTETSEGGDWFYELVKWLTSIFGGQFDNFSSAIRTILSGLFDRLQLQRRVQENLNGCGMFVFPGGKEFKMYNPVFNNELDLIVNTQYEFY